MATGFHFIYQIKKDVPATIVYPEHDDSGIQHKCQRQLEALLSIPHCLRSLSSLIKHPASARPILAAVSASLLLMHISHYVCSTFSVFLCSCTLQRPLWTPQRVCGEGSKFSWSMPCGAVLAAVSSLANWASRQPHNCPLSRHGLHCKPHPLQWITKHCSLQSLHCMQCLVSTYHMSHK